MITTFICTPNNLLPRIFKIPTRAYTLQTTTFHLIYSLLKLPATYKKT